MKSSGHRSRRRIVTWGVWLGLLAVALAGCDGESSRPRRRARQDADAAQLLFGNVTDTLATLPEFIELDRYQDAENMLGLGQRMADWRDTGEPAFGWEPAPDEDSLGQIVHWLNQWAQSPESRVEWTADPLVKTLPAELKQLPSYRTLDRTTYSSIDARVLLEAVWLKRTSDRVRAGLSAEKQQDNVALAAALFDWTVRNIRLDVAPLPDDPASGPAPEDSQDDIEPPADPPPAIHLSWQSLFFGRGTAEARAWVFVRLARQQQLDVVLLTTDAGDSGRRLWTAALLHEGQLHLFDPALGLAIPGLAADTESPLDRPPATLAQVAADEQLLRQLDLDESRKYPIDAAALKSVVALIEASPSDLSRRMKMVEARLAGDARLVLTTAPTQIQAALAESPHVSRVEIWTYPWEIVARQSDFDKKQRDAAVTELQAFAATNPPWILWKGRTQQLYGEIGGQEGANWAFLMSRPPETVIRDEVNFAPLDERGKALQRHLLRSSKQAASFWLGTLAFEQDHFDVAIGHLQERTLDPWPEGPWRHAARYGLARACEEQARANEQSAAKKEAEALEKRDGAKAKEQSAAEKQLAGREAEARVNTREAERLNEDAATLESEAADLRKAAGPLYRRAIRELEPSEPGPQDQGNRLRAKWLRAVAGSE